MTYLTQSWIAGNYAMRERVAQCATVEKITDPDAWMHENTRIWAAAPGWDAAWEYALNMHPEAEYDPGKDEAVITDGMILAQVQAMNAPEPPPEEET